MLFALLSLVLADTRVGNLPPYQWPADKFKSAAIGASGTITWRDDGSQKNAVLDCPGVDPTGVTYSDVGINACIAALAPTGDPTGQAIYFPRGVYKLQNSIDLTHRVIIYGDGMTNTWFYPDPAVTAFVIHYPCENGHSPACDLPRSDLSVLRDFGIEYALNASPWVPSASYPLGSVAYGSTGPSNLNLVNVFQVTTAGTSASTEPTWGSANEGDFITDGSVTWHAVAVAGIRFNARATVRDVYIDRSSGNGILIQASTPSKNANSWNLDNVYLSQSRLNGMYVQGADTNAGIAHGVHSGSNRLWGIYDNSFLGNTYEACSVEANDGGAYAMVGVAATNILNGCYSESGEPASKLQGNSMAIGGLHGAGFTSDSGAFRMAPGNRFETNGAGITFRDLNAPSGAMIQMPYANDYLMNLTNDVEGSVGFTVQAGNTTTNQGWWTWRHANLDGRTFMKWGGTNADDPYNIWFPAGAYIGNRIFMDSGASAPSWSPAPKAQGSFRVNTSLFPQNGFAAGVWGWQQQGNGSTTSNIVTLRWPQIGNGNEKILTANPSGSPYAFNWLTDAGLLFTNIGATAKQYVTLTTQAFNPDLRYTELYLYVEDSDGMRVTAGGNTITYGLQSTSAGGYLESTTPGSWLKLKATSQTGYWWAWDVAEISGVWTDGTQTFTALGSRNVAKTSGTYNVTAGDTGTTFTNRGATGTVTMQLPTAAVGLRYRFSVDAAQAMIILNNTGDTITMDGVTFDTASLPQLVCNSATGSTLDIEAMDTDHWYVTGRAGKWELDTFTSVEFHRDLPPYETYLNPNAGKVLTIGATGELSWQTPSGASGSFVQKSGDTMTGPLGISGALSVTGYVTGSTGAHFGGTVGVSGNVLVHGGLAVDSGAISLLNATAGVVAVPTSAAGWVISDPFSNQFETINTSAPAITFDHAPVTVASGFPLVCSGDLDMTGSVHMGPGGSQLIWDNTTNGQNVITMPTGQTQGLVINDKSGQWYGHFDTQNQTFNFDVTSGYNGQVYFNNGNVFFNGSHLNNILVIPNSDTDALDVKDTGGTYLIVMNTVTKGFAIHGTTTNDAAGGGYIGEHTQDFVYAPSGPTGSGTSFNTQTVLSRAFTAGEWMVRLTLCTHDTIGGANTYGLIAALSDTTNSLGSSVTGLTQNSAGLQDPSSGTEACVTVGPTRISLASTTTYYAVLKWIQTVNHATQLYGGMEAWRPR